MSVAIESADQLIRERFHLDDSDDRLASLTFENRVVDHTRSLTVTVPLESEQTTDVIFVQSAQFIGRARTNAILFPPIGKRKSDTNVAVRFKSDNHSVGQTSFTIVNEVQAFSAVYERQICTVKSTDTGDVLAVGAISNRSGKTITIGGYNDERRIFAWPSSRIMLCYDKPPIQYSLDDSVYALVQTERPMSEHEDIELRYSLENTLRADMQYNVSVLTGTNVCTFDTTYTVYNQSSDVSFDRISTLNIVDQTQRQQTVSRAMLRAPTAVSHYYAASSSSSPLEATTSQYEVEEAADSLVRPVYFSYTQPMSIGKTQTVELFNGEPAVVNCLLAYQTTELQPYMKASTPQVSTVLWFDTKTLVPLLTRSATTKVSITHADAKTTSASFSWNRDADATYIYSDKPWLAKYLSTMDSSRLSIENDGVEESTTEVTLKFHVSNFLPERAVIAFPVFPNQTDGRCSKVEYVPSKHADTSRRVVVETPEWASSALPQLYSVFSLEASERLNFLAHFSRRS